MKRRNFLKTTCAVGGLAVAGATILESCQHSPTPTTNPGNSFTLNVDLTSTSGTPLNTVGGSMHMNGVVIVKKDETTFTALADACTHRGCKVNYDNASKTLICPCHNGVFSLDGKVVSGPPPTPLAMYKTSLRGNLLTVTD